VNLATIVNPGLPLDGRSERHNSRIAHMCSKVLSLVEKASVVLSRMLSFTCDSHIDRSIEPDAMCCAVGSNRTVKTSPE
jgi:hypothetical protein